MSATKSWRRLSRGLYARGNWRIVLTLDNRTWAANVSYAIGIDPAPIVEHSLRRACLSVNRRAFQGRS